MTLGNPGSWGLASWDSKDLGEREITFQVKKETRTKDAKQENVGLQD